MKRKKGNNMPKIGKEKGKNMPKIEKEKGKLKFYQKLRKKRGKVSLSFIENKRKKKLFLKREN